MSNRSPIFVSALLLTGVNLLLRFVGTSFQVYISNQIGAAGIGLLQLVMSVGSLCMIAGMGGIRTGTMYLTAEELGKESRHTVPWILSGCIRYSILCSCFVGLLLYGFAPLIAEAWIGDLRVIPSLRLYAAFLPVTCLCGVMTGLFTAANRIRLLAAVEIAEQFVSICVTIASMHFWADNDSAKACMCVIMGGCVGACLTLVTLTFLHWKSSKIIGTRIAVRSRIMAAAIPLALGDLAKAGINTTENLMVPKQLHKNASIDQPLAAFGTVSGMVFPIIMFPACILFALAELLIPELARCTASESRNRIGYLTRRSLKISLLYGLLLSGLIYLSSDSLCQLLYGSSEASTQLKQYAILIPILYCDAITDAMTKGMGQQKECIKYNIITSFMDVVLLYILLPRYGMTGYFVSFAVTHLINFLLSLRRSLQITKQDIPFHIPAFSLAAAFLAVMLSRTLTSGLGRLAAFPALLISLLTLSQVLDREDVQWIYRLCFSKKQRAAIK